MGVWGGGWGGVVGGKGESHLPVDPRLCPTILEITQDLHKQTLAVCLVKCHAVFLDLPQFKCSVSLCR